MRTRVQESEGKRKEATREGRNIMSLGLSWYSGRRDTVSAAQMGERSNLSPLTPRSVSSIEHEMERCFL